MPYLQALAGPPPEQTQTSRAQVSRPHPHARSDSQAPGRWDPGQDVWMALPGSAGRRSPQALTAPQQHPPATHSHGRRRAGRLSPQLCQQAGAEAPLSPPQHGHMTEPWAREQPTALFPLSSEPPGPLAA